eukprot:Filipodium_phascolosomae@DN1673_c0_g1_i1.p1
MVDFSHHRALNWLSQFDQYFEGKGLNAILVTIIGALGVEILRFLCAYVYYLFGGEANRKGAFDSFLAIMRKDENNLPMSLQNGWFFSVQISNVMLLILDCVLTASVIVWWFEDFENMTDEQKLLKALPGGATLSLLKWIYEILAVQEDVGANSDYLVHHFATMVVCFCGAVLNNVHCYIFYFFGIASLSTIFLVLGTFFQKYPELKRKYWRLQYICLGIFLVTFFILRVVIGSIFTWQLWFGAYNLFLGVNRPLTTPSHQAFGLLGVLTSNTFLMVLQYYWFSKMISIVTKKIWKPKDQKYT